MYVIYWRRHRGSQAWSCLWIYFRTYPTYAESFTSSYFVGLYTTPVWKHVLLYLSSTSKASWMLQRTFQQTCTKSNRYHYPTSLRIRHFGKTSLTSTQYSWAGSSIESQVVLIAIKTSWDSREWNTATQFKLFFYWAWIEINNPYCLDVIFMGSIITV